MKHTINFRTTLPSAARDAAVIELQATLVDLIDLGLQAKQLHWTVVGERFKSMHEMLDELAAQYRQMSDAAAERCTALGIPPDGRAPRVATDSILPVAPTGFVTDTEVADAMSDRVLIVAQEIRQRALRVSSVDSGSEDLLLGMLRTLEQQAWMLQAQTVRDPLQDPSAPQAVVRLAEAGH